MTKTKPTVRDILPNLPEPVQAVALKTFEFEGENYRVNVRLRTSIPPKPPIYLVNLDRQTNLSSLYWNAKERRFWFDLKDGGTHRFYSLGLDLSVREETHGHYPEEYRTKR